MAILRLSDGRIFYGYEAINNIVAPMSVGKFDIPAEVMKKIEGFAQPLSHENAMYVLENLDPGMIKMLKSEGFTHRRVGNIVPPEQEGELFRFVTRWEGGDPAAPPTERTPEEIAMYLTPHYVHVNDWHFVFQGGIIKGLQLEGDLQGIVYTQAGEWIRLNPTILNWPVFVHGEASIGVSYFDRPFDPAFKMDLHPEVPIVPAVFY